jgi:hypothetical protein
MVSRAGVESASVAAAYRADSCSSAALLHFDKQVFNMLSSAAVSAFKLSAWQAATSSSDAMHFLIQSSYAAAHVMPKKWPEFASGSAAMAAAVVLGHFVQA